MFFFLGALAMEEVEVEGVAEGAWGDDDDLGLDDGEGDEFKSVGDEDEAGGEGGGKNIKFLL